MRELKLDELVELKGVGIRRTPPGVRELKRKLVVGERVELESHPSRGA